MVKYYVYTTIFVWLFFALSYVMNEFVYRRKVELTSTGSNIDYIRSGIQLLIYSLVPFVRLSVVFASYKLLVVSDEELIEISKGTK